MTLPKAPDEGQLIMKNAQLIFRNFAGREGQYNQEGDRNFCILLDPDTAQMMADDGWNIKLLRAREEGDEPQPYIQVSMKFRGRDGRKLRPPTIVLIASKGRTNLSEEEAEILDWVDIAMVDLIIRPFRWNVNGKSGIKAYLRSIYITIQEDELQLKYQDIPEARLEIAAPTEEELENDIIDVESWEAEAEELKQLPSSSGRIVD